MDSNTRGKLLPNGARGCQDRIVNRGLRLWLSLSVGGEGAVSAAPFPVVG